MNIKNSLAISFVIFFAACSNQVSFMYTPSSGDSDAKLLSATPPVYEEYLRNERVEGYVIVEFSVNERGKVFDAKVLKEFPEGVFSQAALRSVYSSLYRPKYVDGIATPVTGLLRRVTFYINGQNGPAIPKSQRSCENSTPERNKDLECKKI